MSADKDPFEALRALRETMTDKPETPETSAGDAPEKENDGIPREPLHLYYERKGRGGKEATIIECPESMTDEAVARLGASLKRTLGTGGSVRGCEILLQGDRRTVLRARLAALGYKVKG